jgi:putative hydrolases of HD superfamily
MAKQHRDVEFMFELGALRFQQRQWHRFYGINFANITEHHFRVMWLALTIAAREGVTNTDKIMKMALVHDIAESRAGDVDYISRQYTDRNEEQGIKDMLADTALEKEFLDVWREYEDRKSIESKIVKDADNLDVDLELREQAINGVTLEKVLSDMRDHVVATKLYTKSAQKMAAQIRKADPHDWHTKAPRNRINGGDWKKK